MSLNRDKLIKLAGNVPQVMVGLTLAALFLMNFSEIHSFDVFWQLQSGKYIWQTKSFIYTDLFSLAKDVVRVEHCWLHDIILYAFYSFTGYAGISFLKGLILFMTGLFLVLAARVRGASWLSILIFLAPAISLTRGGWLERPQIWTFLLFAVFIWFFERYRVRPGRYLWLLIPLAVAWSNLHAGAVLSLPVLAVYLAGNPVDSLLHRIDMDWKKEYRRLLIVGAAVVLAMVVTPYGAHLLESLGTIVNLGGKVVTAANSTTVAGAPATSSKYVGPITQIYNMDWRPTSFARDPGFFYAMGIATVTMLLGFGRLRASDLFLMIGLGIMGMKLGRHTSFFLYACVAILPAYLDDFCSMFKRVLPEKGVLAGKSLGLLCGVALTIYFFLPVYKLYGFANPGLRTWHYPVEAAEFVKEHRLPANIYNTYDWGGYLMWTLYPDYLVFWDGRSDSIQMFEQGLKVMRGEDDWQEILDRHDVKTIVSKGATVNSGQHYPILDKLQTDPLWVLVFSDESSTVFVRRDAMPQEWIARYEQPKWKIDDMILQEVQLLLSTERTRYMGYWEIARILIKRNQRPDAIPWLEAYLRMAPQPDPNVYQLYIQIKNAVPPKG